MKKCDFSIALLMGLSVLSACGGKGKEGSADSDSTAADSAAVFSMVSDVVSAQKAQDLASIVSSVKEIYELLPEKRYTDDFDKAIKAANDKAIQSGNEMGYFDYDILTNSQDPGQYRSAEVVELLDSDRAMVKVTGEGYGENGYVIVIMKYVEPTYLVDDVQATDGSSVKAAALRYAGSN